MAADADIQKVIDNIETDADAYGWSDTEIEARLDAPAKPSRVIATYWRKRASDTVNLVNISESGSSRGMDSVYPRMVALAEKWEAQAAIDETPVADATPRARNGAIVRR